MRKILLQLGQHSFIYGIGNAFGIAGGFLLIPLYTHVLSTAEYGIYELLNRTADICILIMFMGVRQAFIRFYFDQDNIEWKKTVVFSTLAFVLTSGVVIGLMLLPFREILAQVLFKESTLGVLFGFLVVWLPLELLVKIGMTHLQIQMKSVRYVMINVGKFSLFIISNILLVYVYRKGVVGILISNIWIGGLIGIGFLYSLVKWTGVKISFGLIGRLLKFGLPYLPTTFFMFIISSSDRYFLTAFSSLEEVGIYALGYKIGMFGIMLVMEPFSKVWAPFLFGNYEKPDGPELISKVFTLYTSGSILVALVISVLSPVVIPLISDKAFHGSYELVPWICLAGIFWGMASLADAGILISKKTGYKPIIFGLASVIGVFGNLILIPKFGASGACIALAITFFSLFVINNSFAHRFYPLKIEYRKLCLILSCAVLVYVGYYFILHLGLRLPYMAMCSGLSLMAFFGILWFGGFFSYEEKVIIKGLAGKLRLARSEVG